MAHHKLLSGKEQQKLSALYRRRDFLHSRMMTNSTKGKKFTYDISEHDALCWAIEIVEKYLREKGK